MNPITTTIATALAAAAITGTAASAPIPNLLPHHQRATNQHGWPHQANRAEIREATRTAMNVGRNLDRDTGHTICRTGPTGLAGRYVCRWRNQRGRVAGLPRWMRRPYLLLVGPWGEWELELRTPRRKVVAGARASSATFQPGHTVDRGR